MYAASRIIRTRKIFRSARFFCKTSANKSRKSSKSKASKKDTMTSRSNPRLDYWIINPIANKYEREFYYWIVTTQIDKTNTGIVQIEEFLEFVNNYYKPGKLNEKDLRYYEECFKASDIKNKGHLSYEKTRELLVNMNIF